MTADEPMKDEDEVTVAAGSDVLAQIREEALAIKRERTGEDAHVSENVVVENVVAENVVVEDIHVWSADPDPDAAAVAVNSELTEPVTGFDPSLDKTTVLADSDDLTEFAAGSDPTVALKRSPRVEPQPARMTRPTPTPKPASTLVHVADDGASLIGSAAPPTTSATYFESSDTSETMPASASTQRRSRRRVPMWLVVLAAAVLIIGLSVAVALLVASGAST